MPRTQPPAPCPAVAAFDGIMTITYDGVIEFANLQLEKIFGYDHHELKKANYAQLIAEKYRQGHLRSERKFRQNPTTAEMDRNVEILGRRKNGEEFAIEISFQPFRSGRGLFLNCLVRDVSHVRALELERSDLLAREKVARKDAETASRIKDEFLATLSHELRTPLTTILGWTQELRSRPGTPMPAEIADGLAIIERSAEIQGRLINDLLDSSRIHAGKMAVEVRLINLVDVLALAIASVQRLAEKKAIVIATDFPASNECMVLGDPIRMQQVFWNLLSNALKFTPRGGRIHITLDSSKGKPRPMAEVRFCDSGVGIRDEFIGCIFQRFTQADSSLTRLHGGLGLGLSLVKSLVELHQGTVKAESPGVGKGATFTIALPLASVCPSDRAWAPEIQDAKSARLDGVRALVVDDDTSNLDLFSMMLGSFGAQVRTAESAAQARIVLAEFRPDILLSDISMPIEDGIDLIRSVRNLGSDAGGDIPAIALTAFAGNDDARRVLAAGFSAHVAKPVAKVTLLRAVARLVPGKISPPSSSI